MGTMCEKMDDKDYSKVIKVREERGKQLVSARELYEFIEVKERFTRWMERMLEYGFVEHSDYEAVNIYVQCQNGIGGTTKKDYALTLDCAKQIAMLQRNDRGRQARDYFIQCEKNLQSMIKTLPQDYLSALKALVVSEEEKQKALEIAMENERKVKERDKYIRSNHHKVNFYNHCVDDDEKLYDMLEASKILMNGRKGGRNTLMNDLRCMKILMWNNLPYEQFIQSGYLKVKVVKMVDKYNVEHFSKSTLVTNKGLGYLKKKLDEYYESIAV